MAEKFEKPTVTVITYDNQNRCVCCGDSVPEGTQVCQNCLCACYHCGNVNSGGKYSG